LLDQSLRCFAACVDWYKAMEVTAPIKDWTWDLPATQE
jgi:hypothetical protein